MSPREWAIIIPGIIIALFLVLVASGWLSEF